MKDDYLVRYGNDQTVIDRTYHQTLKECQKVINDLEQESRITWYELLYEPIEKEDTTIIVETGEKDTQDILGRPLVINIWHKEGNKMAYNETSKKATVKYRSKNIKQVIIDMNKTTDKDILDHLDTVQNKARYIKDLIRKDMVK